MKVLRILHKTGRLISIRRKICGIWVIGMKQVIRRAKGSFSRVEISHTMATLIPILMALEFLNLKQITISMKDSFIKEEFRAKAKFIQQITFLLSKASSVISHSPQQATLSSTIRRINSSPIPYI